MTLALLLASLKVFAPAPAHAETCSTEWDTNSHRYVYVCCYTMPNGYESCTAH